MPSPLPSSFTRWLICFGLLAVGSISVHRARANDPPAPPITVEFWIAELSVPAMRGFGLDANSPGNTHGNLGLADMFLFPEKMPPAVAKDLARFLDYLRARGVASMIAKPKLIVPSGTQGSMTIGDLKLDVTPTLQDGETIRVRHQLDIRKPLPATNDLQQASLTVVSTCSTVEVARGRAVLACPCISGGAGGSSPDKLLLVMLRATIGEPAAAESNVVPKSADRDVTR